MPEMLEVETYRLTAEEALGRPIKQAVADDAWFLKKGLDKRTIRKILKGEKFVSTRRIGKLLLLEVSNGHTVGLRFGMSGFLIVDSPDAEVDLVYRNRHAKPEWDRFAIEFEDGGRMRLNDPRRLGGIELDPDESHLGIDASVITPKELNEQLGKSRAPLKARLMDQQHVAGVGNLIADEVLWRAGLDPARPANSLNDDEQKTLAKQLRSTVKLLGKRGGSHTGDLFEERNNAGTCPRDGAHLLRRTVGGRTTYSCPVHQV